LIPYIEIPPIKAGPVEIYAFGILVMISILVANQVASMRAADYGFEKGDVQKAVLWVIVSGFIGAHLVDVFFYHPGRLFDDPLLLIKLNVGLSSFGGFLGAFVGVFIYAKRQGISFRAIMDPLSVGFVAGWPIGRMGCTLAHDHPGGYSDFFLAVAYPSGARHDLGFYEMCFAVVIFFIFEIIRRKKLPTGSLVLIVALIYTPVRFFLDFLRLDDVRYLGLTPAQFASIIFFVVAAALLMRLKASSKRHA
jgi:phosphatidylglycerol:prolipoprotein diacylglycerol transferase